MPRFLDGHHVAGLGEQRVFVTLLIVDKVVFLGSQVDAVRQFAGIEIDLVSEQMHAFRRGAHCLGFHRIEHEYRRIIAVRGGDLGLGILLLPRFEHGYVDFLRFIQRRRPDAEGILAAAVQGIT